MKKIRAFKYDTFGPRFWAGFIDGLVLFPLYIVDRFVAYPILGAGAASGLWFVFSSFSILAYSVVLHGFYGRTVGKFATGVQVLDVTEQPLSLKQAFLRDSIPILLTGIGVALDLPTALKGVNPLDQEIVDVPGFLVAFTGLGWFAAEIITMLWNDKRRALHDFIAGSVVTRVGLGPNN